MSVPLMRTNDLWIPPDTLLHMQYTCYSTGCVSFLGGEPTSQTDRKNSEYFHSVSGSGVARRDMNVERRETDPRKYPNMCTIR